MIIGGVSPLLAGLLLMTSCAITFFPVGKPEKITKCFGPCENSSRGPDGDNGGSIGGDGGNGHHNKVKEINRLFRSSDVGGDASTSSIDSIPIIPKANFSQLNATNANFSEAEFLTRADFTKVLLLSCCYCF
jgi:hypothetical protein